MKKGDIVKKPLLSSFTNEVLVLLSKQKKDKDFDDEVRNILVDRYNKLTLPYIQIYLKYSRASGVEKLAYGDVLVTHLIEGGYRIEGEVLEELLPNLSIENIWALSKSSDDLVREKSREYLFDILDFYEKKFINMKTSKPKILKKKILNILKEREKKNDKY